MKSCKAVWKLAFLCMLAVSLFSFNATAKTRWSTSHIIPDADMLSSGEMVIGYDGFGGFDSLSSFRLVSTAPFLLGITEWMNMEILYVDGMSLGLKGRILGETGTFMPSLALGVHNLFTHKEAHYFSVVDTSVNRLNGEIFLALGRNIDPIKMRVHLGVQSIPNDKKNMVNPYLAFEKYFGFGLYTTAEGLRRDEKLYFSLFANWRFWRTRFEVSIGAVDIQSMLFDKNNKFAISLAPASSKQFVKPGFWAGIKYHGKFGFGKNVGFIAIEDNFKRHDILLDSLSRRLDTLNDRLKIANATLTSVNGKLAKIIDSVENDPTRIKNILYSKLMTLKTLYAAEPFEPEKVQLMMKELVSYRDKAVPSLISFLTDVKTDRSIRMYSAQIMGEIGNKGASDVLLDILAQTSDPDIKIEILIALGKLKETRAMYLLQQMSNSPDEAVALTAQEVLFRLSRETGAELPAGAKPPGPVPEWKPQVAGTVSAKEDSSANGKKSVTVPVKKGPVSDSATAANGSKSTLRRLDTTAAKTASAAETKQAKPELTQKTVKDTALTDTTSLSKKVEIVPASVGKDSLAKDSISVVSDTTNQKKKGKDVKKPAKKDKKSSDTPAVDPSVW